MLKYFRILPEAVKQERFLRSVSYFKNSNVWIIFVYSLTTQVSFYMIMIRIEASQVPFVSNTYNMTQACSRRRENLDFMMQDARYGFLSYPTVY